VFSQCVCTVFFAYSTSQSVAMATAARTLGGALNGAVPISKTYVGEITDSTNQGLAMTLITASWGAGLVLGPALGGFLSSAATKYPFLDYPIIRANPYALPMVVVATICLVAAILGWVFLPETLDRSKIVDAQALRGDECEGQLAKVSTGDSAGSRRDTAAAALHAPLCTAWLPPLLRDPTRYTIVLLYAVLSIQGIGFDEMYNVWLAAPLEAGGMGYSTDDIGTTLVIYGVSQICITAPLFQLLEKRLGMVLLFQCSAVVTAGCYFFFPLVPRVTGYLGYAPRSAVTWTLMVLTVSIARISNGITFVIQAVFTNNSVDQLRRGAMNGLSMTLAASVRSVTPLIFGWTFGVTLSGGHIWPFDISLVFTLSAVFMLHAAHVSSGIPLSIETQYGSD
jgi:hypothetical protein